jgi:hypothetical protein
MKRLNQIGAAATGLFRCGSVSTKRLTTVTVMLTLSISGIYAQEKPVTLAFSGTSENSATNLQQPNTSNDEDNFAGKGTLGSFTVRNLRAIANSPSSSSTCSGANQLYLEELAGGGVFRFQDGSLLYLNLTEGHDCIDLVTNVAHCTLTFKITGGTHRFNGASGILTMTETVDTVLSDALNNPVFFGATGKFTGTISGIAREEEGGDEQP